MRRFGIVTIVAALTFGTTPAFAQDEPTSAAPPPVETVEAPSGPWETAPYIPPTSGPTTPPVKPPELPAKNALPGVLYADRNANTVQDPGEALSGVVVSVYSFRDNNTYKVTTDANGEFVFRDLPPGSYQPLYDLADGWVVHHDRSQNYLVEVMGDDTPKVTARAERPYRERLAVTGSLDRESYHYPASAAITFTITNISARRITGVEAACNTDGSAIGLGRPRWPGLSGPGLALEPGEQRTFRFVEELRPANRQYGKVALDCQFVPIYGFNKDGPTLHVEAAVTSDNGGHTMVVGEDRNADSRIGVDEAVQGVEVALVHPQTGKQVAVGTSSADGKIEFADLALGDYQAVVRGSWAFRDAGKDQVQVTKPAGSSQRFLKRATPAELRGEIKFDKERYESHETVNADLTITNVGGQAAERVRTDPFSALEVSGEQWGDLRPNAAGIRIPAGESRTIRVSGEIRQVWGGKLLLQTVISHVGSGGGISVSNTVEVVQTSGDITGVVYTDKNRNGQMDPGEGAAYADLEVGGGVPLTGRRGRTDENGRFFFNGLPSGYYTITYTLADGWIVHLDGDKPRFRVTPGAPVELVARAERPHRESLKATVVLDKSTYQVGDTAKITVTLTNTSDREIRGVQAACNRDAEMNHLGGRMGIVPMPEGWGDLRPGAKGVTLAPGETRTIVATDVVPGDARRSRAVYVACDFAPNAVHNADGPSGYDWASVPGGFGAVEGMLLHDVDKNLNVDRGEAVANTRIVLMTDRAYGAVVAETVSDAAGRVYFEQVPPGEYWAWVDGPWKFENPGQGQVHVGADSTTIAWFTVVPGPHLAPPGTGDSRGGDIDHATTATATGGGTKIALARTGASVLGLAFLGALLVAAGVALRRRPAER